MRETWGCVLVGHVAAAGTGGVDASTGSALRYRGRSRISSARYRNAEKGRIALLASPINLKLAAVDRDTSAGAW